LDRFRELEPPVAMAEIRGHRDELLALRQRMQDQAAGQPIYFPWIPYRDTLRTFQSYLVKMPQEAISLFPKLRALVDEAASNASRSAIRSPAEQAMQAMIDAAGKIARRGGAQGFQVDQNVKVAVEVCAMNAATEFYREDWDVEDVHGTESHDLICRRHGEVKHVEVKGTTEDGVDGIDQAAVRLPLLEPPLRD
jgi:hypothetical protein